MDTYYYPFKSLGDSDGRRSVRSRKVYGLGYIIGLESRRRVRRFYIAPRARVRNRLIIVADLELDTRLGAFSKGSCLQGY